MVEKMTVDGMEDSEQFFDELAIDWDEKYEKEYFYRDRINILNGWLKSQSIHDHMELPVALDVGCGTGQAITAYSANSVNLIGIDISDTMLKAAAQRDYQSVLKFDGTHIPYEDDYFDVAHMFNVIEFVEIPEALLSEVFRVLKKDARFLMTITNSRNIIRVLLKLRSRLLRRPYVDHPQLRHAFVFSDAKKILKNVGFKHIHHVSYSPSDLITAQENRWYYSLTRNKLLADSIYIEARK